MDENKIQIVFIKSNKEAKTPVKNIESEDAGWDLFACDDITVIPAKAFIMIRTGIKMAIPNGYFGQIVGRSGMALRGLQCHIGTIDAGYRGEVCPLIYNHTSEPYLINKGDKVCQLLIKKVEDIEFYEVDCLPGSKRGDKGFGSSGR